MFVAFLGSSDRSFESAGRNYLLSIQGDHLLHLPSVINVSLLQSLFFLKRWSVIMQVLGRDEEVLPLSLGNCFSRRLEDEEPPGGCWCPAAGEAEPSAFGKWLLGAANKLQVFVLQGNSCPNKPGACWLGGCWHLAGRRWGHGAECVSRHGEKVPELPASFSPCLLLSSLLEIESLKECC